MSGDPYEPVLMHETTPAREAEDLIGRDPWPDMIVERIRREMPTILKPLTDQMQPGDTLWHFRSRLLGVLAGHEGVALVRGGAIVDKIVLMHR